MAAFVPMGWNCALISLRKQSKSLLATASPAASKPLQRLAAYNAGRKDPPTEPEPAPHSVKKHLCRKAAAAEIRLSALRWSNVFNQQAQASEISGRSGSALKRGAGSPAEIAAFIAVLVTVAGLYGHPPKSKA